VFVALPSYSQPKQIALLSKEIVTKCTAAYGHTLCITATGALYSWGSGHGLLGLSDARPRLTPTAVELLKGVEIIDIACGYDHSLALNSVGNVYSWGNGGYGQLGQVSKEATRAALRERVALNECHTDAA